MADILVTTLGKATAKDGGRYRSLNYRFENGFEYASSFFMQALLEYRKHLKRTPDKILVLGTESSMWDALLEQTSLDDLELMERLAEESASGTVSSATLQRLDPALSEVFGVEIKCVLVPAGRDTSEQAEILRVIAEQIPEKATVCFDVTHGYRTLPLIELLSIFYLAQVRQAEISDIFYGAADMRDDSTDPPSAPVVKLDFINQMLQWLTTLPMAEQAGRFDKLAELFPENSELGKTLSQYSLAVRTNQTVAAQGNAEKMSELLQEPFADPVAELYRPALQGKINWRKGDDLAAWQILSAKAALRIGDLLRASILLREARISLALPAEKQSSQKDRDAANALLHLETDQDSELLTGLRNCLAHAAIPDHTQNGKRISRLLKNSQELTHALEEIADRYYEQCRQARYSS